MAHNPQIHKTDEGYLLFYIGSPDDSAVELQRRERPQLFRDGEDTYLFTTAKINGETRETGGETWNMVVNFDFVLKLCF